MFRLTIEKSTSISQQGKVEARCAQNNNLCSSTSVNQELFLGAQYSVPLPNLDFKREKPDYQHLEEGRHIKGAQTEAK